MWPELFGQSLCLPDSFGGDGTCHQAMSACRQSVNRKRLSKRARRDLVQSKPAASPDSASAGRETGARPLPSITARTKPNAMAMYWEACMIFWTFSSACRTFNLEA